jgi:hypothetical protein
VGTPGAEAGVSQQWVNVSMWLQGLMYDGSRKQRAEKRTCLLSSNG